MGVKVIGEGVTLYIPATAIRLAACLTEEDSGFEEICITVSSDGCAVKGFMPIEEESGG